MKTSGNKIKGVLVNMIQNFVEHCGDSDIERFIVRNKGLIINHLNQYYNFTDECLEDLFQETMIMVMNIYSKYDPAKGRESTYIWRNLKGTSRLLGKIISRLSGMKRLKFRDIIKTNEAIASLDLYDERGTYIDLYSLDMYEDIDNKIDMERDIRIIKRLLGYDIGHLEKRNYDILLDTRPYKDIAHDYGISLGRVPQIKARQINKIRDKIKNRGIEL